MKAPNMMDYEGWTGLSPPAVTPQVSVHLNTITAPHFKLKRKMLAINSKRRGQIKVKVNKGI